MKLYLGATLIAAMGVSLPLTAAYAGSEQLIQFEKRIDLQKAHAEHVTYHFSFLAEKGELKPTKNNDCVLILTGKNIKEVVYQAEAPTIAAGSITMSEFEKYWSESGPNSFGAMPPTAGVVHLVREGGHDEPMLYAMKLNSIQYDGKDTVSFGCTFTDFNQKITKPVKLKGVSVIVDGMFVGS